MTARAIVLRQSFRTIAKPACIGSSIQPHVLAIGTARIRLQRRKTRERAHPLAAQRIDQPVIIFRQARAISFRMPKMQHGRCEVAILAANAGVQEPNQQVGVLASPAVEGDVKTVHPVQIGAPDRQIA